MVNDLATQKCLACGLKVEFRPQAMQRPPHAAVGEASRDVRLANAAITGFTILALIEVIAYFAGSNKPTPGLAALVTSAVIFVILYSILAMQQARQERGEVGGPLRTFFLGLLLTVAVLFGGFLDLFVGCLAALS